REILTVIIGCHFLQRQPTVFGLTQMPHYRTPTLNHHAKDGVESWIVNHHQLTLTIFINHSNILPDLYPQCTLLKTRIQPCQAAGEPTVFVEAFHRKGRNGFHSIRKKFLLGFDETPLSAHLVHLVVEVYRHIENADVVPSGLFHEIRLVSIYMNVHIGLWNLG